MKIIIDADACPVTNIALEIAEERRIPCTIVCDNAHYIVRDTAETIVVDKGADSADLKIANIVSRGDVVVTQDYGLAALILGKGGRAINQNGLIFNNDNIENLLYSRFVNKKIRLSGGRTKGPSKRTPENDRTFRTNLLRLLEE